MALTQARWGDEAHTFVSALNDGSPCTFLADSPAMARVEGPIADYVGSDAPAVSVEIADWQFAWQAAAEGFISNDEAIAWSGRGEVPQTILAKLPQVITDPDTMFGAKLRLAGAKSYRLDDPLVPLLGALFGKDADGLATFWEEAARRGATA